jgi:hypothetical protein
VCIPDGPDDGRVIEDVTANSKFHVVTAIDNRTSLSIFLVVRDINNKQQIVMIIREAVC